MMKQTNQIYNNLLSKIAFLCEEAENEIKKEKEN